MANLNPWKAPGVANVLTPGVVVGDVFYVDGENGSDNVANPGTDPHNPLLTITRALALCTDDENDVVIVLNYPEGAMAAGESDPIDINKNRVHLLGAAYPYLRGDLKAYIPGTADAVFQVSARWVEIAYFKFGGIDTFGCISFSGGIETKGCSIHHCSFGIKAPAAGPSYGIDCSLMSCGNWMYVGDCVFADLISSHGIYLYNPAHIRIERNHFSCVGGDGIRIGTGAAATGRPIVVDNYFAIDADGAAGKGINIAAGGTGGGLFAGNMANEGKTDMGSNPWVDPDTGAPKNAWMGNYLGITLTHPA